MQPFKVSLSNEVLDDLKHRLQQTRWPRHIEEGQWARGADLSFVQRLCEYWSDRFDWRAAEARLNAQPQFRAEVDGMKLHLVHARSERADAVPLLLLNGWPSSIFEYLDVIPLLTEAGFHVVAPAMPGYGFSDQPTNAGMTGTRISDMFATLMSQLGYEQFIVHGSDWGSLVADRMRRHHPDRLLGVHLSNINANYPAPADVTPQEQGFLGQAQGWQFAEGAYAMIQGTKPQTLSFGLNDSPAGLAAWIVEKFQSWSDRDAEDAYGLDGLCANLTLYWATQTIGSSIRLYAEIFSDPEARATPTPGDVPVGVIVFAKDILPAPRAWGERFFNIVQWTATDRGGHFGAWEEPNVFAKDLTQFAALVSRG